MGGEQQQTTNEKLFQPSLILSLQKVLPWYNNVYPASTQRTENFCRLSEHPSYMTIAPTAKF
jgi:hypothetical protein